MIYLQIEQGLTMFQIQKSYGFVNYYFRHEIEAKGLQGFVSIGSLCTIHIPHKTPKAEFILLQKIKQFYYHLVLLKG